jgi:hypothetical protein
MPRRACKGNDIADIGHAGDKHERTLEAEAVANPSRLLVRLDIAPESVILRQHPPFL